MLLTSFFEMGRTKRERNKNKSSVNCSDQSIFELQKWLGLKNLKLKICNFKDTGRGVKCLKKIQAGEELISIPLQFLISSNCKHDVFGEIVDLTCELILTLFLMYETHLDFQSSYWNYIKILPQKYTNLYFCNETEYNLLPNFLKDELLQMTSNLKLQFQQLQLSVTDKSCCHCDHKFLDIFTYDQFVWAWFTVNTRGVFYPTHSEKKIMALAPLLDMFNHSDCADVKVNIDREHHSYVLRTEKAFQKYDQVFIKYGAHSNIKLLLEYGFILTDNSNDLVEFSFQKVCDIAKQYKSMYGDFTKLKYKFIKNNSLNVNLNKNNDEFSWNFNGLLYILVTRDQELSLLQSKTYSNNFSDSEWEEIVEISKLVVNDKVMELSNSLRKMEELNECSESFQMAKDLIKMQIKILS